MSVSIDFHDIDHDRTTVKEFPDPGGFVYLKIYDKDGGTVCFFMHEGETERLLRDIKNGYRLFVADKGGEEESGER